MHSKPVADQYLWNLFYTIEGNQEAKDKARELCGEFLGGSWAVCGDDEFEISQISGGMTNLMFRCDLKRAPIANEPTVALLRIQCQKDMMQLQNELAIFITLAKADLGPELLGIFPGGRLEQYIPSTTLTYEQSASQHFSKEIAKVMAKIHQIDVPLKKKPQMVPTMRSYIERIKRNGGAQEWNIDNSVGIPEDNYPTKLSIDEMSAELDKIEKHLEKCIHTSYLCHNDLTGGNILLKDGFEILEDDTVLKNGVPNDNEDALVIIDFEFGSYNFGTSDIQNFMIELAYDHAEGYNLELAKLKCEKMRGTYCRAYLEQTYKLLSSEKLSAIGYTGDIEKDLPILLARIDEFSAISHYPWGLWNIVCVQENIPGMDFNRAFRDRFALYHYFKNF